MNLQLFNLIILSFRKIKTYTLLSKYKVVHKEWDFRVDCAEIILFVSFNLI